MHGCVEGHHRRVVGCQFRVEEGQVMWDHFLVQGKLWVGEDLMNLGGK